MDSRKGSSSSTIEINVCCGIAAFPALLYRRSSASRLHALNNVGEGSRQSNAGGPKRWLIGSATRLLKGLSMPMDCE
jgi:hypothetical protein